MKAKTITEIHSEAENNLGLHPGATTMMRNGRNAGVIGGLNTGGFPVSIPGSGVWCPECLELEGCQGCPGLMMTIGKFLHPIQCQGVMFWVLFNLLDVPSILLSTEHSP